MPKSKVVRFKPLKKRAPRKVGGEPKPVGRTSKFHQSYPGIAKTLCAMGATDAVLADAFDVSTVTIFNWQTRFPEFRQAVVEGKAQVFDPLVERALAQRAMGYAVDTEEIKIVEGKIKRVAVRKHFPPDVTACIFWLKNRQPDKWKDAWKVEHDGKLQLQDNLTAEQLLEQIRKEAAELNIFPEALMKASGVVLPGATNGKTKH